MIALVGNKIDLCDTIPNPPTADLQGENYSFAEHERHQDRKVTTEEASQYAADYPLLFFETSARLDINVDKVFSEIGKQRTGKGLGIKFNVFYLVQYVPDECLQPVRQSRDSQASTPPPQNGEDANHSTVNLTDENNGPSVIGSGCAC